MISDEFGRFFDARFWHFSHAGFPRPCKIALPRPPDTYILQLQSTQDIEKQYMETSFWECRVSEMRS